MTADTLFVLLLAVTLGLHALHLAASALNQRALRTDVPPAFRDRIDSAQYSRSQAYTRAKSGFGMVESSLMLAVLLLFWTAGGFAWLNDLTTSWGFGPLVTGLLTLGLLGLARWLLGLPFEIHYTFGIEERFGFNRTTPATFIADQVKSLLLGALLGLPVLALVLWFFLSLSNAWLWAWLAVSAWSLFITFLSPSLIFPLFNKFTPLDDGELKQGVEAMAAKCGFPLGGIFVIDGSRRSSKANAYFSGFGRNRRIALYDTLIARHGTNELLAVLAHEIGHFKLRHIWKQVGIAMVSLGLMFWLLGVCLGWPALYGAFGIETDGGQLPVHLGFVFFSVLYRPVSLLLGIAANALSRRHEFEADAFASATTGQPADLSEALVRLSIDGASNLTPHPLMVWLDYSHPPVVERLAALETTGTA